MRKIVSLLLIAAVLLSMLPAIAFADETETASVEESLLGITYSVPEDWEREIISETEIEYYTSLSSPSAFHVSVHEYNFDAVQFFNVAKGTLVFQYAVRDNYEDVSTRDIQFSRGKGLIHSFKAATSEGQALWSANWYFIGKRGIAFQFAIMDDASDEDKASFAAQQSAILKSVNFDGFDETAPLPEAVSASVASMPAPAASTPAPTAGEANALQAALQYLKYSAFSYEGLIDQLEYEGYTHDQCLYAVDHCGADWNEQALQSAKNYLKFSAFSYSGLIDQLEYSGFTYAQALYAASNCGADWSEQAALAAATYLKYSAFSRTRLIEQLEYVGFTHEQAVYGVEKNGL